MFAFVSLGREKRCCPIEKTETIIYALLKEQASSIIGFSTQRRKGRREVDLLFAEEPLDKLKALGKAEGRPPIRRLPLLWDRGLNRWYSLLASWLKGHSFCSNRRLPIGAEEA